MVERVKKIKLRNKSMDGLIAKFPVLQNKKAVKIVSIVVGLVALGLLFNNLDKILITITSKDILVWIFIVASLKFVPEYLRMKSKVELYEKVNKAKKKRSKL